MQWVERQAAPRIVAGILLLLCLTVPPLEFVPFARTAPMAAIAAFCLGMGFMGGRAAVRFGHGQ